MIFMQVCFSHSRWTGLAIGAAILGAAMSSANADPIMITADYTSADITAADEVTINSAISFFNTNITTPDPLSFTIAFGAMPGGGASTETFNTTATYSSYLAALTATQTSANDATALATLPAGPNNPVTGSQNVVLRPTLAVGLGLGTLITDTFSDCGNATATACIQVGDNVLTGGAGGTPNGSLFGAIEHEIDEVLGTSSALRGTNSPPDPTVADLFRYGAPGVRSFSTNANTAEPCNAATPTAYLSINGGVTNLNTYNNCNNGGDYGDWADDSGTMVQDAFGPDDVPSSLTLTSPEVTLLDVVGFNIAQSATTGVPEPGSLAVVLAGISGLMGWRYRAKSAA